MSKIKMKSSKEKAYDYLKDMISSGSLKPNERIVETKIAKELNISRTPVREAIFQLEREGIVIKLKDRGAVVKKLTLRRILEFYELKIKLEDLAIEYFFRLKTKDVTEEIKNSAELIAGHFHAGRIKHSGNEMEKWKDILLNGTKNEALIMILNKVYSNLLTFNADLLENCELMERKVLDYQKLTDYFIKGQLQEFRKLNERINGEELKIIMDSIDRENL